MIFTVKTSDTEKDELTKLFTKEPQKAFSEVALGCDKS